MLKFTVDQRSISLQLIDRIFPLTDEPENILQKIIENPKKV
jgi:hypothetical protein